MKKRELKKEIATLKDQNTRLLRLLSLVTVATTVANLVMTISRIKNDRQAGDDEDAQK